jgi:predicted permease
MRAAEPAAVRATLRDLSEKIRTTPGVTAASMSLGASPLQGEDDLFFWIDGQPKPANTSEMSMTLFYQVEPDYLAAMGIPLKQGRFFTAQDDERSQPVALVDEVFAHKYFGTEDPIGQRVHLAGGDNTLQIIGVVGHVKQWSIDADNEQQELQVQLYLPFRQLSDDDLPTGVGVVVRSAGASGNAGDGSGGDSGASSHSGPPILSSIRQVVQSQSSQNVISGAQTMNEVIAESLAQQRFSMILLGALAVVALSLASLGIYGVISYLVGQRTHELGIRLALGAQPRDVLRLVLGHGMKMALSGVALGLAIALGMTRLMAKMLYGVSATDPATFVVIPLLLTMVALVACFVPAWRATQVDPLVALRDE